MDSSSEAFIFLGVLAVLFAAAIQQMIPSPPVTCVGIDLGTTFSCIAVFEDGDVTVINNRAKSSITPSVIFQPADGSAPLVVGEGARATAAVAPGTLVYDAKRFIGKRYAREVVEREGRGLPFALVPGLSTLRSQLEPHLELQAGGQRLRLAPEDVGTLIVHELRMAAEAYVGRTVANAVLAVPVGFNAKQINATKQAAINAGFNVLRTIHEPTAAAMAYGLHTNSMVNTVMVYDIGGGTLDVSLLNLNNGIFEVIAAAGDNRLGGQDFNLIIFEHLIHRIENAMPAGSLNVTNDAEALRALREEAERVKLELNDEADCSGVFEEGDTGIVQIDLPQAFKAAGPLLVDRAQFEALVQPLLQRALQPVRDVLARVEMGVEDVDELVLVGGTSRMARLRALLRETFGRDLNCDVSPEEAVAHGTAIQAAILTDRKKISVGASEAALHEHIHVER